MVRKASLLLGDRYAKKLHWGNTVADMDTDVLAALVGQTGITYLFDRGYIHYTQYLQWLQAGILFVARLKQNSKVKVLKTRKVKAAGLVLDAEVELTCPKTGKTGVFRLVEYKYTDKKKKVHLVRVLTNAGISRLSKSHSCTVTAGK
ncbi:transposase [Paenibacillus donghaensis]|uniref:transposase n=1 Tax=Paenibacillus donghaensis TaxID=414771 RepID=UPI0012FE3477|nr:transposase [Paenibacillus donghaensis]